MVIRYETVNDAARAWVREFNAIDTRIVELIARHDYDAFREVTTAKEGDFVTVLEHPVNYQGSCRTGEVCEVPAPGKNLFEIDLDDGVKIWLPKEDFEVYRDGDLFPMWGTMWSFDYSLDICWLEEEDGIDAMSRCGFRVYLFDEYGYFFGIDGAGYDFWEAHWEPLYNARGLQWHESGYD